MSAATITNTALTSNVATYLAANSFLVGENVTVTGLINNAAVFNVTNQPIVSATPLQFSIAIAHADIVSGADSGTAVIVRNVDGSSGKVEISTVQNILGSGAETGSPSMIAPQLDDNAGNITFRFLPVPDQIYQINIIHQKRIPALIATTAGTWAPIPDHYSYIYQHGFLALLMAYWNDPRWTVFNQKFVASLLGAAEGLSEEQRNLFQKAWLDSITEQQGAGLRTQQGHAGRGQ